jgi:hypothetical protein
MSSIKSSTEIKYNVYIFSPCGKIIEKTWNMKQISEAKTKFFKYYERIRGQACTVETEKYDVLIKDCEVFVDEDGVEKDLQPNKMVSVAHRDTGGKFVCMSKEQYERLPMTFSQILGFAIAVSNKPVA